VNVESVAKFPERLNKTIDVIAAVERHKPATAIASTEASVSLLINVLYVVALL
jgi:hypothetical protein